MPAWPCHTLTPQSPQRWSQWRRIDPSCAGCFRWWVSREWQPSQWQQEQLSNLDFWKEWLAIHVANIPGKTTKPVLAPSITFSSRAFPTVSCSMTVWQYVIITPTVFQPTWQEKLSDTERRGEKVQLQVKDIWCGMWCPIGCLMLMVCIWLSRCCPVWRKNQIHLPPHALSCRQAVRCCSSTSASRRQHVP